ncbi:MAG TPA: hypothetical protein VN493_20770 [Thermoanaerobaculia bacterium]|nr:hypothetical protein [Thermoanaerobaculia bacterium]
MSEDLRQLRAVMRQAISASGLSIRRIETAMSLGHGNLDRILDGRNELRVRHIVGLARLLNVPAQDFLELGFPQQEAKYRLHDWIMPREIAPPNAGKPANGASGDVAALVRDALKEALGGELKDSIRAAVREEMDGKSPRGKR